MSSGSQTNRHGASVPPGEVTALLKALAATPEPTASEALVDLHPGEMVGRFRVLRRLGHGGFGVVYEAHDEELGRPVALKLVRVGGRSALREERLQLEAEAAARLSHPSIVALHDVGRTERGPFLVLELLTGTPLSDRLARGPVPVDEAVRIAAAVAAALAHAHGHGVVHRDLKPGNVFLCEDGQVKVLDFGLAHAFGRARAEGGTVGYMAPEQRTGAPEDERTDVFALGVLLHEMLTGRLPFGDSEGRTRLGRPAIVEVPAAPALGELVGRMLERDPVRRPRSGREVAAALEEIRRALEASIPATGMAVRRRRPWLRPALLVAGAAAVGAALAWWIIPPPRAPAARGPRLAVADVMNATNDPDLELLGLLRTVIEQSTYLDVVPPARLLDALPRRPDPPGRLDGAMTREAARRVQAAAVVIARLLRLGETYVLEVQAENPATGDRLFSFKEEQAGKEALPVLLDRAGERARLQLGEPPDALRRDRIPARSVTASLEAWRAYARGMACFEARSFAGTFGPCLLDLRQAVAIDPGFALAHLQISLLEFLQGAPRPLQLEALRAAQGSPERIPPHERRRLAGWAAWLEGREVEAKRLLGEAARATPDDKYAWWLAGDVAFHRDEFAEALPYFRRVHALAPGWLDATWHLVVALGVAGDLEGVRGLAAELEAHPELPDAGPARCFADLWGARGRALDTCRAAAHGGSEAGKQFFAIALLNLDRHSELRELLGEMERTDGHRSFPWYMRHWLLGQEGRWSELGRLLAAEGDPDDAWYHATLAEMLAGSGDAARVRAEAFRVLELDRGLASNLAVHLAYLGDLPGAAGLAHYLPPDSPRETVYRAVTRWRAGDPSGAVPLLRQVAAGAPQSADPNIPPPLYLLGEALADAGQDLEAIDVLQRYRAMPVNYPTWFWQRSDWFLARSLDRLGRREAAREALSRLLGVWQRADASQPWLAEARALAARLAPP